MTKISTCECFLATCFNKQFPHESIHPASTRTAQVFCISQHSKSLSFSRLLTALTEKTQQQKQLRLLGWGCEKEVRTPWILSTSFGGEVARVNLGEVVGCY